LIHELKTWPCCFDGVGVTKMFELRKNDRGFNRGDMLVLKEWNSLEKEYTGREKRVWVISILRDAEEFGLRPGFVIMSIEPVE
jgi:hypothetical protein